MTRLFHVAPQRVDPAAIGGARPAPGSSSSSSSAGVGAWVQSHQREAIGGAAACVVALLALRNRRAADAAAAPSSTGDTASRAGVNDSNGYDVAGLSGTPFSATASTDVMSAVQDALQAQTNSINDTLAKQAATPQPPTVAAPPPIQRPGGISYRIVAGDTLGRIAMKVYGQDTPTLRGLIKRANPVLAGFGDGAVLGYFVGRTIAVPAYAAPPAPHKPAKPAPHKPAKPAPPHKSTTPPHKPAKPAPKPKKPAPVKVYKPKPIKHPRHR